MQTSPAHDGVPGASTLPSPHDIALLVLASAHVCGAEQHVAAALANSEASHFNPEQEGAPTASTLPPSHDIPLFAFACAHVCGSAQHAVVSSPKSMVSHAAPAQFATLSMTAGLMQELLL